MAPQTKLSLFVRYDLSQKFFNTFLKNNMTNLNQIDGETKKRHQN